MPKIEQSAGGNILIDSRPYSRGELRIEFNATNTSARILQAGLKDDVVQMQPITNYTDNLNNPFADFASFVTYLDTFFFRNVGGGGSGTGWQAEVNTFADLPPAGDHTGEVYLVKTKTGSLLTFNLKRSGFYQSDGATWTKLSGVQFLFNDDELTFSDNLDNTKQLGYELSNISTGTRRTATWQDKDITVAGISDIAVDTNLSSNVINSLSHGLLEGGELSVNGGDNTKFDISDGSGVIIDSYTDVNNPVIYPVSWSGLTAQTVTNLATSTVSFIYIDNTGSVVQTTTEPMPEDRRNYIFLGQLGHSNLTTIATAVSKPDVYASPINQLRDLFAELSINEGNQITANGANLSLDKSNGYLRALGNGFFTDVRSPNRKNFPIQTLATLRLRALNDGSGTTTVLDPLNYDLGGTITPITGTKAQNLRVYLLSSGNIVVLYGQTLYNSLVDAIQGIDTETFIARENVKTGQLLAVISILSTCTDLTNTSRARIFNVGKFGDGKAGAGGVSVTTLQQAYNNSNNPEITTDSTRGAFDVRRGSAADTDDVFTVQNGAGTKVFGIDGQGSVTGGQISLGKSGQELTDLLASVIPSAGTTLSLTTVSNGWDFLATGATSQTASKLTPLLGEYQIINSGTFDLAKFSIDSSGAILLTKNLFSSNEVSVKALLASGVEIKDSVNTIGAFYPADYFGTTIAANKRRLPDVGYTEIQLGGNLLSSAAKAPTVANDQQPLVWHDTSGTWDFGTSGGSGPTSYSFAFGRGGTISSGNIINAPVSGTASNQLGIAIPVGLNIIDISITFSLTSVSVAGNLPILVRELTTSGSGVGFPLTSTVGTLKRTINCSIGAGTIYHRTFTDTAISGVSVSAGNLLFVAVGTPTYTGSVSDCVVNIRAEKV